MSIKDDVNYIKNELSSEEKFLESFVKTERFFKKYKKLIVVLIITVIVGSIAFLVKTKLDEKNLYEANIALSSFLENVNQNSLDELKEKNRDLYEIALYLDAKNEFKNADINLKYLKELLDFQVALLNSNQSDLDAVSKKADFLLKDYAIFNQALILVNNQKYAEAREILGKISQDSRAFELATLLKHYLVTK
ncbi:hypothetical protein [Aliarcobacter cryaerophilus]|uniref:Tetratricopeptide repeat-like domain-containing protein n=2 Tax=unclassified Arcobacter TaxID=2593671 RepID=A0AA96D6Y8_9BACT|nr:hypothetical protein RJG52_09560 [Arcobacter sp. AZ-2023]WPD10759.1 hypothetical protein QUR77_05265 [Arcobacter sp. DSM 115954]WNL15590.1 hypothetical protein RJG51_05305 [Arcobacter sp. AZ-2023]WNL18529.1 hypothetical protein RJG53_07965 [Arcobacter sp. AZ-2023]WNL20664.1 hypothetical protein RJG56_07815 [Arcobacter sp. AZ-2023]